MLDLELVMNYFDGLSRRGYGKALPGKCDDKFVQLADLYLESTAKDREEIRTALPDSCRLVVIGFSDRMAILAERLADRNFLMRALAAHSIEDFKHDDRENTFRLVLANHVAGKIGEEPSSLIKEIAGLSSDRGAAAFRSFLDRPPEMNTLATMKIVEKQTDAGIDYQYQE